MKIIVQSLVLIFITCISHAQQESGFLVADSFGVTPALRDLPADASGEKPKKRIIEMEDREKRKPQHFEFSAEDDARYGNDPKTIQNYMGTLQDNGLKLNIAGQSGGGARPFDPSGAAGINHYVQVINATSFKVYNKSTGASVYTHSLGTLWSPATANDGDPIVMYDKAADRWFIAQFGLTGNKVYIAISTTGDPSGSYYTYTFTSPEFPDYLKFSVWHDGYYMTSNLNNQRVFAFERSAMINGVPGARMVYTSFNPPTGNGFFCPLTGCAADGVLPPAGTPCPIFSYSDNGWGGSNQDRVNIYKMTVNWTPTTPTATITAANNVSTGAFDASYNSSWNDVAQPNTTQKLDGIGGVCMYRAQWKSWGDYNSVVLNWAVKINNSQRSIKWCELRQDVSTGTWTMYQEGIYTPDTDTRWMGSIVMDDNGSIGLSYMKTNASSNLYPGLYYTGRRSCDPLGTFPITEQLIVGGSGSQTGTNRTGDYAHGCLDPDGITIWGTSEYMGGSTGGSAARTRIFSYQIEPCIAAAVSIALDGVSNPICLGEGVTLVATPAFGGSAPQYEWFINGVSAGANNDTLFIGNAVNGDVITCNMISNEPGLDGILVESNEIVLEIVESLIPSVSISTTQQVVCEGAEAEFIATTQYAGANPSYQWFVGTIPVGSDNDTLNYVISSTQNVTCILTSGISCASPTQATSAVFTITPQPIITPELTITASADTINPGQFVTFTATAINAGNSPTYQWYINGIALSGATSSTYTSGSIGNGQTITCRLVGQIPCSSVSTVTSNGITIVVEQPNSIEEWSGDHEMLIYPNPSMGEVTFKARHAGTFYMVNDAGQLVREIRLNNSNNFQLKIDNLASGAYIVAGQNAFGIVKEKLVIVR